MTKTLLVMGVGHVVEMGHVFVSLALTQPSIVIFVLLTITNSLNAFVCFLFFSFFFFVIIYFYLFITDCGEDTCNYNGKCNNEGACVCNSTAFNQSSNCGTCSDDHYNNPLCTCMHFEHLIIIADLYSLIIINKFII